MKTLSLKNMILSASGWRKIFSPDGDNGYSSLPSRDDLLLATGMGLVWGNWLTGTLQRSATVLVGMDTRPTGPALAEMIMRGLEYANCRVLFSGITASPELMARSGRDSSVDAFACVTASHNPVGYNGLKVGTGGSVLGVEDACTLIDQFKTIIDNNDSVKVLEAVSNAKGYTDISQTRQPDAGQKKLCLTMYREFLTEIAGGTVSQHAGRETLQSLKQGLQINPVTVVADFNGSARAVSVDRDYLESLGAELITFNDKPGQIVHDIVPEGSALESCCRYLEDLHSRNSAAILGYVPDNDGDRGNLVIWDDKTGMAKPLEAQEVFALATLAELACMNREHISTKKNALIVSGPTSHRIRDIAMAYGVDVFESEVGEANVINRANQLRNEGYRVRLLGEGSNGGTIVHPATVRDPLNTITAILKLLRLSALPGKLEPITDWLHRAGKNCPKNGVTELAYVLATLPEFITTPASDPRAIMIIRTSDHAALKAAWERIFLRDWPLLADRFGFFDWVEFNNEGALSHQGMGPKYRSGLERGGLKVVFRDKFGRDVGFIWMRGSGTEPVFRVIAEVRGRDSAAEATLLDWHKRMVTEADDYLT